MKKLALVNAVIILAFLPFVLFFKGVDLFGQTLSGDYYDAAISLTTMSVYTLAGYGSWKVRSSFDSMNKKKRAVLMVLISLIALVILLGFVLGIVFGASS